MEVLSNLEPKEVFHYFEKICSIPHPSYKEDKLSDYCVAFAKEHNLEVYQDELKNIVMIKEATPGYEDKEPVILQGHIDMVCEKEPDCKIDFENDGLTLKVEGDYVTAEGTTLGGDDGIAVAYALAILASDTISHPRLEVVFTVSEEVGMEGAAGIDVSMLKGRKLINLDSEDEGIMLASCAGGCSMECMVPSSWEEMEAIAVDLRVAGLMGGHSGTEIDKGRANSNTLMGRILLETAEVSDYGLASMQGGTKDNAIPRETTARILVPESEVDEVLHAIEELQAVISKEYSTSDPDICISAKQAGKVTTWVLTKEAAEKTVLLLNQLPNGIQKMSADIPGLVQTSLNLGILTLDEEKVSLRYAVRSSVGTEKEYLLNKLEQLTSYVGGSTKRTGDYPAWEYKKDSTLREDMERIYEQMYGKKPVIQAIHAGVECGILSGKLEGLDCISLGPDMIGIHTTEEKLSISSTKRVWEYLLEVIKA